MFEFNLFFILFFFVAVYLKYLIINAINLQDLDCIDTFKCKQVNNYFLNYIKDNFCNNLKQK